MGSPEIDSAVKPEGKSWGWGWIAFAASEGYFKVYSSESNPQQTLCSPNLLNRQGSEWGLVELCSPDNAIFPAQANCCFV